MEALLRLANEATTGSPSVVLVSGEPGIGKTRLLDDFRALANRRAAVGSVSCPSFAPESLGPIHALFGALGQSASNPRPGAATDTTETGQLEVFAERPIIAMIDDTRWADTATLEFLKFTARELSAESIMLVVAYRSEDAGKSRDLEGVVDRISRYPNVHHIKLQSLSAGAIAELIDATLGDRDRPNSRNLRDVRERCEGNPLFAEELLKSSLELQGDRVPSSLRSLVGDRTAGMSPEERHFLEIAALIGRRFSVTFLETIAGAGSRQAVLAFLRLAIREHFLIEDRKLPGGFEFRHALVRDAILAPVLLVESCEMHLIARALEREPDCADRVVELSEHFWQAGAKVDCLRYARIAGERSLARFAYREAAEQFERALACAPEDAAPRCTKGRPTHTTSSEAPTLSYATS